MSASSSDGLSTNTSTGEDNFGAATIKYMVEASEATSTTWAQFYKKLQLLTSTAVDSMPPHRIKIIRSSTGYIVSILGPVYDYRYNGTKVWAV